MFDIGWSEMLVIAVVLIVVVGPKDLPRMLRTFGKTTAKLRAMAGDFQRQFNEALKEAELDDVKKSVDELRGLNPATQIRKQLNPFEQAAADVRAGLDSIKPGSSPAPAPATDTAEAAEPLKNGATAMPGVAGPEVMPPPTFPEPAPAATPAPATQSESASVSGAVAATEPKPVPKTAKASAKTAKTASARADAKAPATKPAPKASAPKSAKTATGAGKAKPAARKTTAGSAK